MEALTKTEQALLGALENERRLLQEREMLNKLVIHEISNAVTAVLGGVELVRMSPQSPTANNPAFKRVENGARAMRELLAGLKLLLRESAQEPQVVECDLIRFIDEIVSHPIYTPEDAMGRVIVRNRLDTPWRQACPELLRHALANLVRNALHYGNRRRGVRIVLTERPWATFIHVSNAGPKIDRTTRAQLFVPRRKSLSGGMGVGLYIAREAMRRCGGDIKVGSSDALTVFSILLPNERVSEMPLARRREVASQLA